ncbi:hypothetical protein PHYPSEUDO_005831 [Phytophthora pseudosyringae]|uniref:Small secreted protein n=1 Tax=Phytophthora pseudosyringae TaxID=221518 RepID=A0A8T1WFH2_9STRA|nr:hypothetical protein PHYPSEUDO_005831 [Phytophthora pseudosyringae]
MPSRMMSSFRVEQRELPPQFFISFEQHNYSRPKMRVSFALALALLAAPALVSATLSPCKTNSKGKCPSAYNCKVTTVSKAIQAAECSHNTRTHNKQTFAVFVQDHQYDGNHGYPYGTCSAYTCDGPTTAAMKKDEDCWTFFWNGNGTGKGVGTDCIRDPKTGECGCESSIDGKFVAGKTDCK